MTLNLKITHWLETLLACSIACLILILPSVVNDELMNGTQSGKFFFFTYFLLGILILWSVGLAFKKRLDVHFSIIDILVLLFVGWVSLNKYLLHDVHALSLRYFELLGLFVLYVIVRSINKKYHTLFFVAICLSGTIQAVYGNLQLWGYYPSHHGLFKMTGSFFNPGPFAGFLCCVLPVAVGLYWKFNHEGHKVHEGKKRSINNLVSRIKTKSLIVNLKSLIVNIQSPTIKLFALFTIITILLVLPAARSRAAWLGAIAGVAFLAWHKFNLNQFFKPSNFSNFQTVKLFRRAITLKNRTIVVVLALVLLAGSFSLYHYKKDSADGRLLIWKVTANMIKDYPMLGVGQDLFKAHYMDYQADYFRNHPNSKYEMVADDNQYAFNEPLNIWVENGLIGFLLFMGIVVAIFFSVFNHKEHEGIINHEGHKEHEVKYEVGESQLTITNLKPETITKACILAILVFGLFAYPSEILPIKIIATVCIALLAGMAIPFYNKKENSFAPFVKKTLCPSCPLWLISFRSSWLTPFLLILSIVVLVMVTPQVKNLQAAYKNWNDAFELYNYRLYTECLEEYQKAYPLLQRNGEFLVNYGKALSTAEKHTEAIIILGQAKKYLTNTVLCTALGDSQKALKQYTNPEKNYWLASDMAPVKFYPQYLLAKLYNETGYQQKAVEMATSLLQKTVKVESTAINEIHEEMKKIIDGNAEGKSLFNENTTNGQKGGNLSKDPFINQRFTSSETIKTERR